MIQHLIFIKKQRFYLLKSINTVSSFASAQVEENQSSTFCSHMAAIKHGIIVSVKDKSQDFTKDYSLF